jgi:hypothetical protein
MTNEIKTQICKEDFYLMLRNAVVQSGGADNLAKWKTMKLEELVNLFASNGIRMTYMPEKHMDNIKVVWEDPRQANELVKTTLGYPKKKQLLCDQKNLGEEDENVWEPSR